MVGLIYPSDYGYATSGGETTNRSACLNLSFSKWAYFDTNSDCPNNNWLYVEIKSLNNPSQEGIYTITPVAYNPLASYANRISGDGRTGSGSVSSGNSNIIGAKPAAYLKPSVKIVSGTGSESDPFVLGL